MAYTVLDLHTFLSELIGEGKGDLEVFEYGGDQVSTANLCEDDGTEYVQFDIDPE